jgi:hypothetical protein
LFFWTNDQENGEQAMDTDTLILLMMLTAAFGWWFKLQLDDTKKYAREIEQQEKDRLLRVERIKQLVNKQ